MPGDGVTKQRPVEGLGLVEEGIELRVRRELGPRPVEDVLVRDHRDIPGRHDHRRLHRLGLGLDLRSDVVAVAGHVGGPDQPMTAEVLGPEDVGDPFFHPVDEAVVEPGGGAGRIDTRDGIPGLEVLVNKAGGRPLENLARRQAGDGRPLRRDNSLAEIAVHVEGGRLLDDVHDLKPNGVAGDAIGAQVAQQLDEHASLVVERLHEALRLVVPQGAQFLQRLARAAVRRGGIARPAVFIRHRPREARVIHDVDRANPRGRDGDGKAQRAELALRPVNGAGRLHGAARDGVGGGVEQEDARAVGLEAHAARRIRIIQGERGRRVGGGLAPRDADGAGLVGVHHAGVRAPVIAGVRVAVGRVGLGQPILLLEDLQDLARLINGRDGKHTPEVHGGCAGRVGRPHAEVPQDQDVRPAVVHHG